MGRFSIARSKCNYTKSLAIKGCLSFLCGILYPIQAIATPELIERLAAIVNDKPILYSSVMEKVERGPLILVSPYPAKENSPHQEQALQDLINLELVMLKVADLDIQVTEDQVDDQIKGLLEHNHITLPDLKKYVEEQGKSFESYREDLKRQMLYMRFKGRELVPKIKVTERDVQSYYLKTIAGTGVTQQYAMDVFIRHILLEIPQGASADIISSKERLATQIYSKLQDGLAFSDAVKIYSDQKSNNQEAIRLKFSDLPVYLQKPLKELEPGNFTTPIRTSNGIQIVFVEDKKFTPSEDYLKKKEGLEQQLREQQLAHLTQAWIENARQRAKIYIPKG